jgi:hypothetical protein
MNLIDPLEPEFNENGRIVDYISGDLLEDRLYSRCLPGDPPSRIERLGEGWWPECGCLNRVGRH